MADNPLSNQGNKSQGGKKQGGKKQPPKKQGGKKQGPKNQGPKNQGPKNQGPKTIPPISQPPVNQGTQAQVPRNQGGNKQGGKKQGNKQQRRQQTQTDTTTRNTTPTTESKDFLNTFLQDPTPGNLANVLTTFDTSGISENITSAQQQTFNLLSQFLNNTNEKDLATADNATRVTLGSQNLQGIQAQADATKFASSEQAGATKFASQQSAEAEKFSSVQAAEATKFAATEQARGSIETQRVASESQERQIGLSGEETRKTDLQSELFRRFKEAKDQLDALKAFKA